MHKHDHNLSSFIWQLYHATAFSSYGASFVSHTEGQSWELSMGQLHRMSLGPITLLGLSGEFCQMNDMRPKGQCHMAGETDPW